jgi:hypothetical protein
MPSTSATADSSAQFWKKTTAGMEISRLSHLTRSYEGQAQWRSYPVNPSIELQTLSAFCEAHRTSLLVILQTAWAAVLGRFLGTDTATFASSLENGDEAKHGVCGAIWSRGATTLHELLEQLQRGYEASFAHQDIPLGELEQLLHVVPDTGVRVKHISSPGASPYQSGGSDKVSSSLTEIFNGIAKANNGAAGD